jgi:hypothetical protein
MGNCPSCGASSFFGITTKECFWCGKIVCDKCVPQWHGTLTLKTQTSVLYQTVGFCSDACYYQFSDRIQQYPKHKFVGTDIQNFNAKVLNAWHEAIFDAAANDFKATVRHATQFHSDYAPAIPWWDSARKSLWIYVEFYNRAKLALAENLEKCGRTQDAASIFEELQMYDKSKALRESDRHILVKNTNVSVNLNALLQQIKDGGIVAVFRCPFCGGKLKVNRDTTLDTLKRCEHCGSEITAMDLADFLKTALT